MVLQKIKKFLCITSAVFLGISTMNFNPDSFLFTDVKADFEQSANQLVEDISFGWNLGNSLDSYIGTTLGCQSISSETSWGNPKSSQALIDGVKASGVNTIRVPVTWYNHMDSDYKIEEAWLNRVEEVVNYVLNDDMYCILNVHHDTGENGWLKASSQNLDTKKEMFQAIWEQISEKFSKYGDKLLFEGFNEILDDNNEWVNPDLESLHIVNDLNQIFVDTVRASGGNNAERCLVVNTYAASGNAYITSNFKLPNDTAEDKLIAECHVYQPFYFTSEFYPEETTWGKNKIYLDEQLDAIYHNFILNGIPAIIGEFGCAYTKDNMDEIISWAKYYVEKCESYGIPCIYWDNGSQYKLYNRNNGSVTQEELLHTMLAAANGTSYEVDTTLYGDANNDGVVDVLDAVILQKWLLAIPDATLANWKAVDLYKDEIITIFDLCLLKKLLIQKENLCSSMDNWSSWVDSTGGASAEVAYQKNGVSITIEKGGANPWDAQIAYKNIKLEQGATYRLSFDYSATTDVTSDGNVMQNHDDYLPYQTVKLHYTPEIQHMESEFTMTAPTDKNCEIAFNCGSKNMKPCTITISNLSLVKISDNSTANTEN